MMKLIIPIISFSLLFAQSGEMSVKDIIKQVDKNLNAKSRVLTSKMVVHGRRSSRTIESRNWVVGIDPVSYTHLPLPRTPYV